MFKFEEVCPLVSIFCFCFSSMVWLPVVWYQMADYQLGVSRPEHARYGFWESSRIGVKWSHTFSLKRSSNIVLRDKGQDMGKKSIKTKWGQKKKSRWYTVPQSWQTRVRWAVCHSHWQSDLLRPSQQTVGRDQYRKWISCMTMLNFPLKQPWKSGKRIICLSVPSPWWYIVLAAVRWCRSWAGQQLWPRPWQSDILCHRSGPARLWARAK